MIGISRSATLVGLMLLVTACGRKGPLIYPDMLVPAAPAAVSAQQSGSLIKLQFAIPDKDRAGHSLQGLAGVKISRRVAATDQKDVCRSCMTDYQLFQTLYLDHLPNASQRIGSRLVVLDSDVGAGNSYSYRIVPFTADGIEGVPYSIANVPMTTQFPAPVLTIESHPTEVRLQISMPAAAVSGRLLGYNLYRSSGTLSGSFLPLNSEPLRGNEYADGILERGVKYRYAGRALFVRESGDIVESAESAGVEGMLKDDE